LGNAKNINLNYNNKVEKTKDGAKNVFNII